ncbi:hypothetical protein [Bdellovibrio sp. HCB-162]|uniref:hypothetical protein n=1 Tax=Bdellovibrio sp. HCB-162 TaxID=3394234 RepID=UPI0039BC4B07
MRKMALLPLLMSTLCSLGTPSAWALEKSPTGRADLQILNIKDVGFNAAGMSDELTFQVPANTKSFLVQFSSNSDYAGIRFEFMSDPNSHFVLGKSARHFDYINKEAHIPYMEWENPVAPSFTGITTALIGNNTATKIIPGTWKMKFSCQSENSECRNLKGLVQIVFKKNISGAARKPTIPLRLHFAGKSLWDAKSVPKNKDFKLFMKVLEDIFKFAGINIQVLSLDDTADVVFDSDGQGLQHMLKYSKGDAVNVYFAKTTFNWVGAGTIAYADQLPGGYMSPYATGVMVRMKTILSEKERKSPNSLDYVTIDSRLSMPDYALTVAHEIAHYLGLFHVCEVPVFGVPMGVRDPLNSACDYKNMMFPSTGQGNFYLTPAQVEVISRHPLVY